MTTISSERTFTTQNPSGTIYTFSVTSEEITHEHGFCDCDDEDLVDGECVLGCAYEEVVGWHVHLTRTMDKGRRMMPEHYAYGSMYNPDYMNDPVRGYGDPVPYIYGVRTACEVQQMGCCKFIIGELERIAREVYQVDEVRLDATVEGRRAYERMGYVVSPGRSRWMYSGTPMHHWLRIEEV